MNHEVLTMALATSLSLNLVLLFLLRHAYRNCLNPAHRPLKERLP